MMTWLTIQRMISGLDRLSLGLWPRRKNLKVKAQPDRSPTNSVGRQRSLLLTLIIIFVALATATIDREILRLTAVLPVPVVNTTNAISVANQAIGRRNVQTKTPMVAALGPHKGNHMIMTIIM